MSEFYTVSQYAAINGKNSGNIRKMLISGALKGEKIGNQWIIPKDTVYPEDRRVKNGKYRNWRQKIKLNSKHPEIIRELSEMCKKISAIFDDSLFEIVLYGSYAKGVETDESDIDMAIMLKEPQTDEQYNDMTDIVLDYELDLGVTLSVVPIEMNDFKKWKNVLPFYKNLSKEGIVLWRRE